MREGVDAAARAKIDSVCGYKFRHIETACPGVPEPMPASRNSRAARRPVTAKTADRTLDVFELFANEQRPLNLSDISELLGIPLSSSHALIKTLQGRGYLYDVGRRQGYFPTTRMQDVTQAIARAVPVLATIRPALSALRDEMGETVVLAKRQGDDVTYVDVFESARTVRWTTFAGEIKPLHSTSSGKAILSCLPPDALDALLGRLPFQRRTEATITSARELREQIEKGRGRGWYHSIGETVPELMAVSAPVRIGGEIYAVTMGGPTGRFKPLMTRHAAALMRACARIEGRTVAPSRRGDEMRPGAPPARGAR
jgi:DNA-binding IclR family transcriptional regulator